MEVEELHYSYDFEGFVPKNLRFNILHAHGILFYLLLFETFTTKESYIMIELMRKLSELWTEL